MPDKAEMVVILLVGEAHCVCSLKGNWKVLLGLAGEHTPAASFGESLNREKWRDARSANNWVIVMGLLFSWWLAPGGCLPCWSGKLLYALHIHMVLWDKKTHFNLVTFIFLILQILCVFTVDVYVSSFQDPFHLFWKLPFNIFWKINCLPS